MLIGEYRTKLGEKNRTAVPKKFREEIGNKCVITQGYERCLIMVSLKQWEALVDALSGVPFTQNVLRDTARFLIGGATEVQLDSQGRFVLPENLLEYVGMGKESEVVFLGLHRWVEIWDKAMWLERKTYLFENSAQIAEKLNEIEKK